MVATKKIAVEYTQMEKRKEFKDFTTKFLFVETPKFLFIQLSNISWVPIL